jgi:hypothetical protein
MNCARLVIATIVVLGLSSAGRAQTFRVEAEVQRPGYLCTLDGVTYWRGILVEKWINLSPEKQKVLTVSFTDYVLFKDEVNTQKSNVAASMIGDVYVLDPMPSITIKGNGVYRVAADISIPIDYPGNERSRVRSGNYFLRLLTGATGKQEDDKELGYTYSEPVKIAIPEVNMSYPACPKKYKEPRPL